MEPQQLPMFEDHSPNTKEERLEEDLPSLSLDVLGIPDIEESIQPLPQLTLPTRWEQLQPKIGNDQVSLRTIIRRIPDAMEVVRNIVGYLQTTGGCQLLVIRAETGSGKTTFLNTLQYYMSEVPFKLEIVDIEYLTSEQFVEHLQNKVETDPNRINLIILEGREKPKSIDDDYIQIALAAINRFSRRQGHPILVVVPTIEEQVARRWCDHGASIGDLIPQTVLYEGSRWYRFPGLPKEKYTETVQETVMALNPAKEIEDFGITIDEVETWAQTAPSIGRLIEKFAQEATSRRDKTRLKRKGRREHVWVVFSAPEFRHFDHNYHLVNGLVYDEYLRASPIKLLPKSGDSAHSREWRDDSTKWTQFVAAINFLDVRLINMPIITVTSSALAFAEEHILDKFKETTFSKYREIIEREKLDNNVKWDEPLAKRRLQKDPAITSMERTNLLKIFRGLAAEPTLGGKKEEVKTVAQYLHLMDVTQNNPTRIHMYIAKTLNALLKEIQFPGFQGIEVEQPLIKGSLSPRPDITIYTETDVYALEFHFLSKQFAASEIARYTVDRALKKYIRDLPHLRSQLDEIGLGD